MALRMILGPQRPVITLKELTGDLPEGPVAVVSAGWQEAEGDLDEVAELVARPLIDLNLYQSAAAAFAADPRLQQAHQERQQMLRDLQHLYRLRLRSLMIAARRIAREEASPDLKQAALEHAIAQIRELDQHHLSQSERVHASYAEDLRQEHSPALAEQTEQVHERLAACQSLLITGGNVAILMNRLKLFGLGQWMAEKPLVAWSAGAMVMSDFIVLFNDHTRHGRREHEVLMKGLGLIPGEIFLPGAAARLKTQDQSRMRMMALRFSAHRCLALDSGAWMKFQKGKLKDTAGTQQIQADGVLAGVNR